MKMTKRRQAINDGRVGDTDAAFAEARLIERLGGPKEYVKTLPRSRTVMGANGLWHTARRQ